jgi:glucose/arabinose dehydrogenase
MINQIKSVKKRTIVIVVIASLAVIIPIIYLVHNSSAALAAPSITKDPNLKVETVVTGLSSPTSMAFIDNNNILVLEKGGQVRLVSNGVLQSKPDLQVSAGNPTESERGLLGIAILNSTRTDTAAPNNNKFAFLCYTESKAGDLRNRVYRYEWNGLAW